MHWILSFAFDPICGLRLVTIVLSIKGGLFLSSAELRGGTPAEVLGKG